MTDPSKPRFLAGVVCPRCGAMDSVRIYTVEGVLWRDCVSCDMKESYSEGVDSSEEGRVSVETAVIQVRPMKPKIK